LNQTNLDELCINTIRTLSLDAVQSAGIGHLGLPMGGAAMGYILWTKYLKHNPKNPDWANRDRFVLSAGHGSMLLYSLLHLTGYDLSLDEIKNFRQWESQTPGHPEYGETAGVETTTGPLGQGFANGVGMALTAKHLAARFNQPRHEILNHTIYGIVSDGDLMEGVAQEAASLAGHLKLDNLIYLYDDNNITIDGGTDQSFSEDVLKRFDAYSWHTQQVSDGNDIAAIGQALEIAQQQNKPALISVKTIIGFGSPNKQGTSGAHGGPYGEEEHQLTKETLGWPTQDKFHVPDEALTHFRQCVDTGQSAESDWNTQFEGYKTAHPGLALQLESALKGELPQGWENQLPTFTVDDAPLATRRASGQVLNAIADQITTLIGGSADLAGSNNTTLKDESFLSANNFAGRNIHFGVREHGMGGILNGMALHGGAIPYGGTFLVFSDYMRASIRLAALMKLKVIYILTHDSIGVGEDGPTHQPVEQTIALRAIPNLTVIRPADGAETAAGWKVALEHQDGPVALILSRQSLPHLPHVQNANETVAQGGYILQDAKNGQPDLILIGAGSEVQWAFNAQQQLAKENIQARVVSIPSWELFDAQPQSYRDYVMPPDIQARLAIEAGSPLGWERYVGLNGKIIALDRFGASAPGDVVMEKFGFNTDNVVQQAKALLG